MTTVRLATARDLEALVPLFDAYRQFYGRSADPELARSFLAERFALQESIVFLALSDTGAVIGFTQLYPMFSSVSASRTYVLNDLFVTPDARRTGVARALLKRAEGYARTVGAARLSLSTAHTNVPAQRLYESLGWTLDEGFRWYHLSVNDRPEVTVNDLPAALALRGE